MASKLIFKSNRKNVLSLINAAAIDAVNSTADEIADDTAKRSPRLSGAMAESVVALHAGEDNTAAIQAAENRAKSKRPDVEFNEVLSNESFEGAGVHRAQVVVPVSYAGPIHFGFADREGKPFLEDAGNENGGNLKTRLSENLAERLS